MLLENGAFAPLPKQVVLTKMAKIPMLHSTHQNKGFCSSNLGTDKSDENGGCHSRKIAACQKHCFRHPDFWLLAYHSPPSSPLVAKAEGPWHRTQMGKPG